MSKRCPKCGSILADDSAFCNKCGAKLSDLCPNCGAQLPQGSRFCNKCGHSMDGSTNKNQAGSAIRQWAAAKQGNDKVSEETNSEYNNHVKMVKREMAYQAKMKEIDAKKQEALRMHKRPVAFILPLAICGGLAYFLFVIAISLAASGIPASSFIPLWVFAALFTVAVIVFLPFAIKMIQTNKKCNAILRECNKQSKELTDRINDPNYNPEVEDETEPEIPIMY